MVESRSVYFKKMRMQHNTPGLVGKTVLITGGAKRIGAHVARQLHARGCNLVIHYRNSRDSAEALQAELSAERPDSATIIQADLSYNASPAVLVDTALEKFGRLDVLINNASSFYPTPLGEITEDHWNDLFASNLKAPLFLSQAAAKALKACEGSIINMVDIHAKQPLRQHSVYCAAKAGLVMLTKSLAKELAPEVRVNGVAPGPILWPDHEENPTLQNKIINATALKRMGDPQDIAAAVVYLIRDASYVTGQVLAVDGGRSVGW